MSWSEIKHLKDFIYENLTLVASDSIYKMLEYEDSFTPAYDGVVALRYVVSHSTSSTSGSVSITISSSEGTSTSTHNFPLVVSNQEKKLYVNVKKGVIYTIELYYSGSGMTVSTPDLCAEATFKILEGE